MNIVEFRAYMKTGKEVETDTEVFKMFHKLSQEALQITSDLNNKYHTPEEIVENFSKLTGREVDKSCGMFPPFYTDCGKNIQVGKNVFINACCRFQDQGGITIGDGCFIGHNVTIATINHNFLPEKRANMYPAPVKLGKNVWVGSDCTILPGVTIGDGAVIGAGSVVTKDIPAMAVAVGNPCKVIKYIQKPTEKT